MTAEKGRRGLPTTYRGWTFRSRLEARVALFMDELGVAWEYEPEGFELPSGLYVPDFWLPRHRYWLEVKPDPETAQLEAFTSAPELAVLTGKSVAVMAGLAHWEGAPAMVGFHPDGSYSYLYFAEGATIAHVPDMGPWLLRDRREVPAVLTAQQAVFERDTVRPVALVRGGQSGPREPTELELATVLADSTKRFDIRTVPGKERLVASMLPLMRRLRSEKRREQWISNVSRRVGIDDRTVLEALGLPTR